MRREFGIDHCDVKRWRKDAEFFSSNDLRLLRHVYPRLKSIAGHSLKPFSDIEITDSNIKYYTFLREPISRCISHYQHRVLLGTIKVPFEEWIEHPEARNLQVQSLAGAPDLSQALHNLEHNIRFVGLIEDMDRSLMLMKLVLGLPAINTSCGRFNAATNNTIREKILADRKCMQLLHDANALDIELYRYAKDVIFERQKEQFDEMSQISRSFSGIKRNGFSYYFNSVYREIVYKPVVFIYRAITRN